MFVFLSRKKEGSRQNKRPKRHKEEGMQQKT